jgi:hypothetical protein
LAYRFTMPRRNSFKSLPIEAKIGIGCGFLIVAVPALWILFAILYAVFAEPQSTAAQEYCNRQGITCDADGYPIGMSEESKRALERGRRDGH